MNLLLPDDWRTALAVDLESRYFAEIQRFVAAEREAYNVYPAEEDVFQALIQTPLNSVKVVIIGQDPYHNAGQAHGLSFSVPAKVSCPPSLRNIQRELSIDLGCIEQQSGCLVSWARQGVLLLNTVLTVRAHQPNSHKRCGWEQFTDSIIRAVNDLPSPCVFILWGASAQHKSVLLNASKHVIIASPHPSPLSAHNGFFGSRPFSRANEALVALGHTPIDWRLDTKCEVID
jgi:uracil-DNA glycosylase